MVTITFQTCPASKTATFTCPSCGKKNRKRTFRHECTASPFNKKPDGSIRSRTEVFAQSYAMAEQDVQQFLREPLCARCEDTLSFADLRALHARRRAPEQGEAA